jgi:hypothetical protein
MRPSEHIQMLGEQYSTLSDEALIEKITALPVLPDEDDKLWNDDATWTDLAYVFVALLDVARERKLSNTIALFLERACYGDPGEMMRGIRHSFEHMVAPDWDALTQICVNLLAQNPPAGARLWTLHQLGILRDTNALDAIIHALNDDAPRVREQAVQSLYMTASAKPDCRPKVIEALSQAIASYQDPNEQRSALAELEAIKAM